ASANDRYEAAGKPGMLVAAERPEALMARRNSGKTSGGTITIGCRAVRITARHAMNRACRRTGAGAVAAVIGSSPRRLLPMLARLRLDPLRPARALQRPAGLGEEHVVETRRVDLEIGDLDALAVEAAHDV